MKFNSRVAVSLMAAFVILFPVLAEAQTLTLTNGVQTYVSLANTTVTMTGRCELRVTDAANPLASCLINLNSVDAWVVLPNVKPSVVVSTYLNQFRVNRRGGGRGQQHSRGAIRLGRGGDPARGELQAIAGL